MGTYFEDLYKNKISKDLIAKYGIKNVHCVPQLQKIVVSAGLSKDTGNKKIFEATCNEIARITGHKPCYRKSRKAIAGFNLKENQIISVFVTLRGKMMYEFLERLVFISLTRIHDFKGIPLKSFDGKNSISFGIKDHLIFVELSYKTIEQNRGINITFTFKNVDGSVEKLLDLLRGFNFPIK